MMIISMAERSGSHILAKATSGRFALRRLLEVAEIEPGGTTPMILNFAGVEVATASFLRECILGFRDAVRMRSSKFYPVIGNANDTVSEELNYLLTNKNDAMLACSVTGNRQISDLHLLGEIDPKHRQTFDLVVRLRETDASTLMRDHSDEDSITRTAWNNRLATLSAMGLIIEVRHGRSKRYMPVLQEP
jgi:hypothetical protein